MSSPARDAKEPTASDLAIAVDLGGTNVRAALISRDLGIQGMCRKPLDKSSPDVLLAVMAECVTEVLAGAGLPATTSTAAGDFAAPPGAPPTAAKSLSGIGAAMKGFVDNNTGMTVSSGFLGMKNVPVGPYLSERFGVPAYVANDVQAATIGEMFYGAGREYKDFVYLNVGTGIATGLVLGGRLYRGAGNLSGEFGYVTVDRSAPLVPGGRAGCLEHNVSGPGIIKQAQAMVETYPKSRMAPLIDSGEINATKVFELAESGDEAAVQVRDDTVAYLGDGIVNLVSVLNPEAIILGGGVFHGARSGAPGSGGPGTFLRLLNEYVLNNSIAEMAASIAAFEVSKLEADKAGLIGAAGLVFEHDKIV